MSLEKEEPRSILRFGKINGLFSTVFAFLFILLYILLQKRRRHI